jgi:mRNA interferase RelE/StbE
MKIIFKGSFDRDLDKIRNKELRKALDDKISQILKARNLQHITGIKLLRGYSHHYRIIVRTSKFTYRIGVIVRENSIWMVRFLPRKLVYKEFP